MSGIVAAVRGRGCATQLVPADLTDYMSENPENTEIDSVFSNEEGEAFTFNLTQMEILVSQELGTPCHLRKLAEGAYHKVYDVVVAGEDEVKAVARVALPDFPVDKMESEVATLKYISENTSIKVPNVIAYSSSSANAAGAEFMILEKIPGVAANMVWDDLSLAAKDTLVRETAKSLLALFRLRFSKAGSLYIGTRGQIDVGPIVSVPFFRMIDGEIRFPNSEPLDMSQFRGPFDRTAECLSSLAKAESYVIDRRRSELLETLEGGEDRLALGKRVLEKVARLAEVYPGDIAVGLNPMISDAKQPFSLRLDDFRPANIMIDPETGKIQGLIDFEATTVSPLWMCAQPPSWIEAIEDDEMVVEHLKGIFDEAMRSEGPAGLEWLAAAESGEHFRFFANKLLETVRTWARRRSEAWVDARLAFAEQSPGVGLRELTRAEELDATMELIRKEDWLFVSGGVAHTDYR